MLEDGEPILVYSTLSKNLVSSYMVNYNIEKKIERQKSEKILSEKKELERQMSIKKQTKEKKSNKIVNFDNYHSDSSSINNTMSTVDSDNKNSHHEVVVKTSSIYSNFKVLKILFLSACCCSNSAADEWEIFANSKYRY